jgi:hypothetical protein
MNKLCIVCASLRAPLDSLAVAAIVGCLFAATSASATTVSFSGTSIDGHAVSGTADFTLAAGSATIKLTNTTATTHDAGELLTGIDFSLGGLALTLSSKTGIERTVAGNGTFSDTGSPQNLSWSVTSLGSGNFQLDFSPDAKDAILGPTSGGNYSGANSSIDGNGGHNPFVDEMATFVVTNANLTPNTQISVSHFLYGTGPDPANGTITVGGGPNIPEPSTFVLMAIGLSLVAIRWLR